MRRVKRWLANRGVLYYIPMLAWSMLIFGLSSMPAVSVVDEPLWDISMHKLAHVLVYLVLAICTYWALDKNQLKHALWWSCAYVILFGISDELHQAFVPTRSAKVTDVLFDTLGGVSGALIYRWYVRWRRKRAG